MYNLARMQLSRNRRSGTFFQQKWAAKSLTRGYHGGTMREGDWERMFSRRLLGTVDIDPAYLARYDGSEQAAGRGSGRDLDPNDPRPAVSADQFSKSWNARRRRFENEANNERSGTFHHISAKRVVENDDIWIKTNDVAKQMTPYMQMTYAPLERRLEVAIFRAMFASSTLQARQFCIHGAVRVNGQLMRSPGYLLNPGDMFQVDVERVLYATGKPKNPQEIARLDKLLREREEREAAAEAKDAALRAAKRQELADKLKAGDRGGGEGPSAEASEQAAGETAVEAESEASVEAAATDADAAGMLRRGRRAHDGGRARRSAQPQAASLIQDAKTLLKDGQDKDERQGTNSAPKADARRPPTPAVVDTAEPTPQTWEQELQTLTKAEQDALARLLAEDAENPVDETKPYLTPWQPRRYIAPFAFIPRYLEVNQNICAAVYLRHPVARRGEAEVPTPFPIDQNQLAFNWYLRRR
ncbi:conserved hypothetical protein [Verticillium alfalfae VaMs.102]|uniref:RNA-binding S4 domain-containing protein n=1 Tax=Verticillium alfalfae (strain VaMs.102 / ATCC MYA-4576 / FGSC 10136) TaxID=526221 RepID=C9S5A8_VERA1|nr:conserved hypothetical protein [Verticillium alfalfae VaMs.102]EEY15016.1 conserved hypothetical protein [Verticillium alfalfae VaMs.102]